jgi:GT2 family glycosyltransferase
MSEASPRVLVMLPVHNRRKTTELFLRGLLAQNYSNWHLLLIDDGSTDDTAEMARGLAPSLSIVRGTGNWWWGGALHQGYRWLKQHPDHQDDLVLIINDDTQIEPDFLSNAVAAMRPASLMLSQLYSQNGVFEEAGVAWDWARLEWKVAKTGEGINCFSTRGLFLYARDFLKIGGFHPTLLPHYLSDYEFTMRARRKGFALITAPQVFLRYDDSQTGIRSIETNSVLQRIKTSFSVKYANNPVYWTSFVFLACPWRHIPRNLAVVWKRFLSPIIYQVRVNRVARRNAAR